MTARIRRRWRWHSGKLCRRKKEARSATGLWSTDARSVLRGRHRTVNGVCSRISVEERRRKIAFFLCVSMKKAFAYRTDFSDSVPAAKPFVSILYDRKKSVSAFKRFPEHLHFLFSEFRHHGIRHLLVEFCVMMECLPSLSGQVDA